MEDKALMTTLDTKTAPRRVPVEGGVGSMKSRGENAGENGVLSLDAKTSLLVLWLARDRKCTPSEVVTTALHRWMYEIAGRLAHGTPHV